MFILKTLTIQMDKIGSQLPNELPHWQIALTALNYSVNKYVLPSRSLPSISSTTLVVDGFAVDCSFISNGGPTNKQVQIAFGGSRRLNASTNLRGI